MKFFGMKFSDLFKGHDVFIDDLRKSAYTINPTVLPDIDLVVVLSGRATVLGVDADNLRRPYQNVAVVSSAYHLARVARSIGQDSPQSKDENDHALSQLNIFLYGIHKNEKRPGMIDDLLGEYDAMRRYSSGSVPSISRLQSKNVFFNDEEFHASIHFNRTMFWARTGYTRTVRTPAALLRYFDEYLRADAPFMHQQFMEFVKTRPLTGLRVLHHVPVVTNTLLKIACLIEAGAIVTVTNPSFMKPAQAAVKSLHSAGIRYVADLSDLKGESFDLYFDCGAELYQALGAPTIGAIELTASGDQFYRQQILNFPVISIDPTGTKQLETVFGCAESSHTAIKLLTGQNPAEKSWVIFGFGKIGRGLAYFCSQNNTPITVVDLSAIQRRAARRLGLNAIDPHDEMGLQKALTDADIVVTATGGKSILDPYPYEWFRGKILANMGIYDEYGPKFTEEEVLNRKAPVNFVLKDPTPMKYIDPEFYIHNIAGLFFKKDLKPGLHVLPETIDQTILQRWCAHHDFPFDKIHQWFISPELMCNTMEEDREVNLKVVSL